MSEKDILEKECLELVKKIQNGEEMFLPSLQNKLKGLIHSIWDNNFKKIIVFDDALDVSFLGIYNAAINYDFSKGSHFSSYVSFYIKGQIIDFINDSRGIQMPEKIVRTAPKIMEIIDEYYAENDGSFPSDETIRDILSKSDTKLTLEEVIACREFYNSIDTLPISDDFNEGVLLSSVDEYFENEPLDIIADIACLNEKERKFLPYLAPYINGETSLKDIATKERVSSDVAKSILDFCKAKIKKKRRQIKKRDSIKLNSISNFSQDKERLVIEYEYLFTDEDKRKIGINVKAFREANGCENDIEFYEFLNRPKGFSDNVLKQIENGSYKELSKGKVVELARLLHLSYDFLVFEDLTELFEKDLMVVDDEVNPTELLDLDDDEINDEILSVFPIISTQTAEKSHLFCEAMDRWKEINLKDFFAVDEFLLAINCFEKCYESDSVPEACVNILSMFAILYISVISPNQTELKDVMQKEYDNYLDFTSQLANSKTINDNYLLSKGEFLKRFNGLLTKYMKELTKYDQYKDYVDYYLAMRYSNAMLDNNIMKLSDQEMIVFGMSLLRCLKILNNKYAIKYFQNFENNLHD